MVPDVHESGTALPRSALEQTCVMQRVPLDCAASLRPLYWRCHVRGEASIDGATSDGAGGVQVRRGATLSTETYFGALFEMPWRLYTSAGAFRLDVRLEGRAWLRLWRRGPDKLAVLLAEQEVAGQATLALADDTHFRQVGYVWFELTAIEASVRLLAAQWSTETPDRPASLGLVICTFNREPPLAAVLEAVAGDAGLDAAVTRVFVANQGKPGLRRHPAIAAVAAQLGSRLHVVEQGNFGGAGGFGRGIIEALDDPAVSHVCLLDDDVQVEPECLRRMAAFLGLARDGVALGGHMLDGIRPTRLYESGAVVAPNWVLQPINHGLDLAEPAGLTSLLDVVPMHFNGWWMFGFDKRLIARAGMPLPCFIRGDDVEFGLRLHRLGIVTVPLPGVGIWHEPFYLKVGGWQLYYETRNALICAALHQHFSPWHVAVQITKRLLLHLLTYRYYNAALVVRAAADFLVGPAILDRDPRWLHASLGAIRERYPEHWTPRERVLAAAPVGTSPCLLAGFIVTMIWALARNWVRPAAAAAAGPARLAVRDLVWFRVIRSDALAVDTYWDRDLPTYQRDRAAFRTLLGDGLRVVMRLYRAAGRLRTEWQEAMPRLTSVEFWRDYLSR